MAPKCTLRGDGSNVCWPSLPWGLDPWYFKTMSSWTRPIASAALLACVVPLALAAETEPRHVGGDVMFVSGAAERIGGDGRHQAVTKGMQLLEGDSVKTNAQSHVYVRMRDGGLLVVRPSSELHVDLWRFDPAHPQDSRIKYTLDNGVARHVSGEGAKAARDKFRFNTPMAAIGVRGTDFTVLAEPDVTRIAVASGGVIVNALGNGCRTDGLGPCEGSSAVELFATAKDKLLQLRVGERRPELIDAGSVSAPDLARPPANGEPTAKAKAVPGPGDVDLAQGRGSDVVVAATAEKDKTSSSNSGGDTSTTTPPPVTPPVTPPITPPVIITPIPEPPLAVWGRWASIAANDPGVVSADAILNGRTTLAINSYYLLAANKLGIPYDLPGAGVGSFSLTAHDGVITDKTTGTAVASTASDASLHIDFGTRRFDTSMTVSGGGVTTNISGKGSVDPSGTFITDAFISPTIIQGIVGGKNAGQAYYLYQRMIDSRYGASGATSWTK